MIRIYPIEFWSMRSWSRAFAGDGGSDGQTIVRPKMSNHYQSRMVAPVGASFDIGDNFYLLISMLGRKCEGYTAHHPKTSGHIRGRPLEHPKSVDSCEISLTARIAIVQERPGRADQRQAC
jgi:hypothetical protein